MSVDKTLEKILEELVFIRANMATKSDVEKNRRTIVKGRDLLLDSIHNRVDDVIERMDNMQLDTISRKEFDALKRKVTRYHTN